MVWGRVCAAFVVIFFAAGCQKTPEELRQADIQAVSSFDKSFRTVENALGAASSTFQKNSTQALAAGDNAGLARAAENYENAVISAKTASDKLEVPDLHNADAKKDLQRATSALSTEITAKLAYVQQLETAINAGAPTPEELAHMQDYSTVSDSAVAAQVAEIVNAYKALGVDMGQVDVSRGGILTRQ